jgi:hypothetical protein
MRRDSRAELVRTEPQRGPHGRVERVDRTVERRRERGVEGAASTERAVYEVGREGTITGIELAVTQDRREQEVGVRAVVDAHQHVERDTARQDRHEPSRMGPA